MEFSATLLGAFFGVVAGVFVQYGCNALTARRARRIVSDQCRKELHYNIVVIDELLAQANRLRDSMIENSIEKYFEYFSFSQFLSSATKK